MKLNTLYSVIHNTVSLSLIIMSVLDIAGKLPYSNIVLVCIILLFFLSSAMLIWNLVCNNKTRDQRTALIHDKKLYQYFDAVTYEEHFGKLLWFQNPWTLYGPHAIKPKPTPKPIDTNDWWS